MRATAGYALWSAMQHAPLRAALCVGGAGASAVPALAAALDDEARVASQAASVLAEIVLDEAALSEEGRLAAWALVPVTLRLIEDGGSACAGAPPTVSALVDLRDSCDLLLGALVDSSTADSSALQSLLEVRPCGGRGFRCCASRSPNALTSPLF